MNGSRVVVITLVSSIVGPVALLAACGQQQAPSNQFAEHEATSPRPTKETSADETEETSGTTESEADGEVSPSKEVPAPVKDGGVVVKEGGTQPPAGLAKCCEGKGTCVPAAVVPAEAASKLKQDTCSAANLCAPTESLGGGKPETCEAQGPFGQKGAGVCVSNCVDFGSMGAALKQGACDADHKCAPCKVFGQATGIPGCPE